MADDLKQTVGRVVALYGLPRPVTSTDDYEAAQLAALVDIRDELREIRTQMQGLATRPETSSPPAAPSRSAAEPIGRLAKPPAKPRRKRSSK